MTVQYPDPFGPPWRFQYLRLVFSWQGGIFQSFWLEWLIAVAASALMVSIAFVATKDKTSDDWPEMLDTLAEIVAFIGRRFQAAIGMMLGFYTSTMYGRWTSVRNSEQAAIRQINNLALRIAWKIKEAPQSSSSPKKNSTCSRNIRIKLVRLLNLSHAIIVGHIYEKKKNDFSSYDKLVNIGLATKKEADFLKRYPKSDFEFIAPLVWFQNIIQDMVKSNQWFDMDSGTLNFQFAGHITDYRNAVADLYMWKNEPVPLIYRQMVNVAVRLYLFMLLLDGIFFEMRKDSWKSGGLTAGSFLEIIKYAFEYFLFVGWLTAADAMGNPFRFWADEVEWIDFVKRISKSSLMIALDYGDSSMEVGGADQDEQNTHFVNTCDAWHPHQQFECGESASEDVGPRKVITGF